jgi:crotonobetainyl-CoA:carnitine CoA-transferase CaiB-like acyl-CoA transferase
MKDQRPLAGLRVIDHTSMIAGPLAAQILADYGADVVKVEPPEGDLMRRSVGAANSGDMGPLYLQLNRNKRSVVLDLKEVAARKALQRLCEKADVFLTNTRPAAMRRLKLAAGDLRAVNPRLIHVGIMGYGASGPYADKPAYDDLIQGICAVPSIVAENGAHEPLFVPLTLADRVVGINTAHAVLAAVIRRDRTGEGQSVEVPMFETVAHFVLADHFAGRTFEPPTGKAGNPRLTKAARRPYMTSDGHVCALIYTNKHWKAFFEGAGRLDLYEANPHLIDFTSRRRHFADAYRVAAEVLRTRTTAEALALLESCDIPSAPMNSIDDLIADPHLAAVGFFHTKMHPTEGQIRYLGIPSRWNGTALQIDRHAPCLGEHSRAILEEAGLAAAEIDALLDGGASMGGAPETGGDAAPSGRIARKSPMS